jgi:hypothetical protein
MAVALVGAALLTVAGVTVWLLVALAAIPWIVLLAMRLGATLAVVGAVTGSIAALLIVLFVSTPLGVGFFVPVVVIWTALGLIGVLECGRAAQLLRGPSWNAVAQWGASTIGGFAWLGVMAVAQVFPGAARLSWAMTGDSANNVITARDVIGRGGLEFGTTANPVPLPSGLLALAFSAARSSVPASALTRHDIQALALTWTLLIALSCVMAGALAGALTRTVSTSNVAIAVVSGGASLLPLSWFFTGYPVDYGFFNASLTEVILMAAVLAYVESDRLPAAGLSVLALTATLASAVWSPLVLIPVALGAATVLRRWRALLTTRGTRLWILSASVVVFVGYTALITLPTYFAQSASLAVLGGAFPFRRWMVVELAIAAVALAILATWRKKLNLVLGTLALGGATAAGLFVLLKSSEDSASRWTYYPLKFSWFAAVILTVVAVGLAAAIVLRFLRHPAMRAAGLAAVTVATLAFVLWAPTSGNGYVAVNPAERILRGHIMGDGDEVAAQIFSLSSLDHAALLWKTAKPDSEGSVNFWLLQVWSNSMTKNQDLRYFAYGLYDHEGVNSLCTIVKAMNAEVTVHTADATLAAQLARACPDSRAVVVVEPNG